MDNLEKNVERRVDQVTRTAEKVGGVANRLQIGCWILFANLFFAGFCLWGGYAGYISWKLESEGETTTGKVIRLAESSSSEGGCCVYSPVIEFQVNGQTYSFEGDNASDPPAYKVGEDVSVIYHPANPSRAQINKWSERWLFPILIIPAMILTGLVVNFVLLRSFWQNDAY